MSLIVSSSLEFTVKRHEAELVVPSEPTPRELKRLSDIDDQESHRFQIPFIFFYNNNPSMVNDGQDPVKVVKDGLGRALVHYYPLAGRLREGHDRKLYVDCTGEGVLFVEATAEIRLDQLGHRILSPSSFLDDVLYNVPGSDGIVGCPLLLIQVTRLLCGGFILAVRLNHAITNGFGLSQFLKTVAEMGGGAAEPSILPVWHRELFDAREPPRITCEHHEYEDNILLADPTNLSFPDLNNMTQRFFLFTPDFMKRLRKQLPKHLANCSSFELLTACFWKCRTLALALEPDEVVHVSCAVSVSGKLVEKLPPGFYGGASCYPAAVSTAKLLRENPLGYAVELVKEAKSRMSEEYIRSAADFMAAKGRPPLKRRGNIAVSDTRFVGLGGVDLGWGLPVYVGPAAATPEVTTFAKYKNGELGREGIVVPVCLAAPAMLRFESELKRMVWEPENNKYNPKSVANKIMSML